MAKAHPNFPAGRLGKLSGRRRLDRAAGQAVVLRSSVRVANGRRALRQRLCDLPLFEHTVELLVPRIRVACPGCGPKLERPQWLEPYARITRRIGESVARQCQMASVRHVACFSGLDLKTVKELERAYLKRTLGPVDLDGLAVIRLDELVIRKGHRYAKVIVEAVRKRVPWVGRRRGREDVQPFLAVLGPERWRRLRAAIMARNASYEHEVHRDCTRTHEAPPRHRPSTTASVATAQTISSVGENVRGDITAGPPERHAARRASCGRCDTPPRRGLRRACARFSRVEPASWRCPHRLWS